MFTARVPGLGLVEWTAEQVDEYARELAVTHRRRRRSVRWRGRWFVRWPAPGERACGRCGEPWTCPSAWWASRYHESAAQAMTRAGR